MANNQNVNKVVYGNNTLIDISGDNVTAGDVRIGKTFHTKDGASATGSLVVKEEQTKSVTATTSAQTVSPDSGKVLSSVTVNPQVHSDTYTPTGYSNAKDMGAQHNYRYVDTSGYEPTYISLNSINDVYKIQEYKTYECTHGASYALDPHIVAGLGSLTPSDSSPQQIYNGTVYQAGGAGYAIESQPTSVTPSSTPASVSSGDIVKIGGSGVIVDSVPPTPTNITPSNISPAVLIANTPVNPTSNGYAVYSYTNKTPSSTPSSVSSGSIYKINGSGYIVDDYNYITPSDSSPVSLSSGSMYRTSGSGYAISSYSSKTPSDSSPPSISSGAIIKASAAGYLYATQQTVPSGTKTITSNGTYDVTNYASASVSVTSSPTFTDFAAGTFAIKSANGTKTITLSAMTDGLLIIALARNGGNSNVSIKSLSSGSYSGVAYYSSTTVSSSSETVACRVYRLKNITASTSCVLTTTNYIAAARWFILKIT